MGTTLSARDIDLLGFGLLAGAAAMLELVARRSGGRIATLADLHRRLVAPPVCRAILGLGWAWLGWHLLAR